MFLRDDQGLELAGGAGTGAAARSFGRAAVARPAAVGPAAIMRARAPLAGIDWVPDLGADVGSRRWWRGVATCTALCAATWAMAPGLDRPILGAAPPPLAGAEWEEARAQSIAPIAWGSATGRRMAANDLVRPLSQTPERPRIELTATLGEGDALDRALVRAGVGRSDAAAVAGLVGGAVPLPDIAPGTRVGMTLGRRPDRTVSRPLERLALRARFDLALTVVRVGGRLAMTRQAIAIDRTPLRVQGLVGSSLYRSARAAGVPARTVEAYIRALATRLQIGRDVSAADSFDLIVERQRAATGEVRTGQLLYAGLDQGNRRTQLVRFGVDGQDGGGDGGDQWFDARGQTERRGFMGMPVSGRITSPFGLRMHPLLRFFRMHKGLDIAAPTGTPIYAAIAGVVQFAGRSSGYGNFVKLVHGGGLASGYGHMSRIAVAPGTHVERGQVIGYVGSTGMSTGPHLHWEVWRNGQPVDPRSVALSSVAQLSGDKLRAFKARVAALLAVKPGGG